MKRIRDFFLFCSGAHIPMLQRAPSETNKYAGIGATVFFTGLMAALSGGYALWTVFSQPWAAVLFGIIWGLMLFNLDRYIVSSMKKRDRFWPELKMALPRLVLALLIAVVISKPLELQVFNKEIRQELVVMEQQVFKTQEDKVRERYRQRIHELQAEIAGLQAAVARQAARRDTLALIAQQEADGTGGSRIRNLGPIYKAKKADADHAEAELQDIGARNGQLVQQKRQELLAIDSAIRQDIRQLDRDRLNGLAARLDALGRLTERSIPIRWANWFIMLLFVAIETAPVFVKLISPRGPYDDLQEQHEHAFAIHRKDRMATRELAHEEKMSIQQAASAHRVRRARQALED